MLTAALWVTGLIVALTLFFAFLSRLGLEVEKLENGQTKRALSRSSFLGRYYSFLYFAIQPDGRDWYWYWRRKIWENLNICTLAKRLTFRTIALVVLGGPIVAVCLFLLSSMLIAPFWFGFNGFVMPSPENPVLLAFVAMGVLMLAFGVAGVLVVVIMSVCHLLNDWITEVRNQKRARHEDFGTHEVTAKENVAIATYRSFKDSVCFVIHVKD